MSRICRRHSIYLIGAKPTLEIIMLARAVIVVLSPVLAFANGFINMFAIKLLAFKIIIHCLFYVLVCYIGF